MHKLLLALRIRHFPSCHRADVAAVALDNDAAGTPAADGTHVQRLVSTAGQVKGSTVSQS